MAIQLPYRQAKPKNLKRKIDLTNLRRYIIALCAIKSFLTKDGQIQHEQAKHKVGTLVEILSTTPTNDDDDDRSLSQPNLPTTTTETDLAGVSDDDSDTDESSFELNDSVQLETSSSDNEKVTETAVLINTEEDD